MIIIFCKCIYIYKLIILFLKINNIPLINYVKLQNKVNIYILILLLGIITKNNMNKCLKHTLIHL